MTRVGLGFDLHPLVAGRPLVLGGVTVPSNLGLGGHSDADVLSHAVAEALLGALALGDLGRHFPDTDPRYRNVSSLGLLRAVMELLTARGARVVNVDATKWTHQPFSATRADGYVYGRGTLDDKDNVVASLMVMLALKRSNLPLDRDVIFLAEAGEEGSTRVGIQFMVNEHFASIDAEIVGGARAAQVAVDHEGAHAFGLREQPTQVECSQRFAFGDTGAAGAIRVPESLFGDAANNRLLVAEEDVPTGTLLREYDLQGRYQGRDVGKGQYVAQAEGIALMRCADGSGWWVASDQFADRTVFHLFDRRSLAHAGSFAGEVTGLTDGVWLDERGDARFPQGVLYASHLDLGVAAFDWRDIAAALELPECVR